MTVPSNPLFERFRLPASELCWWCGRVADTQEHKFKRTDLDRLSNGEGLMWGGDPDRLYAIRSTKRSDAVRFMRALCASCNGTRSQPFDRAYDAFSEYVWEGLDDLWYRNHLDMEEVAGTDWRTWQLDLARYFAKHLGSRLTDFRLPVPSELIDLMDGASALSSVRFTFIKSEAHWAFREHTKQFGSPVDLLSLGDVLGFLSPDGKHFEGIVTRALIGYVGVEFYWHVRESNLESFFPGQFPTLSSWRADPNLLHYIATSRPVGS